jgi:hypothetical protein
LPATSGSPGSGTLLATTSPNAEYAVTPNYTA